MREFIIITVLCVVAPLVADIVWFNGKIFGLTKPNFDFSSVNRPR
jgi:hypothetical protein